LYINLKSKLYCCLKLEQANLHLVSNTFLLTFHYQTELFFSDVDECATEALPCDHTCTNTPGSYECTCNDGYTSWDNGTCTGTVLVKLDPVNVMTYRL